MRILGLLLLLAPFSLFAQSVPNGTITQGQVWTPTQWNTAWQAKVDVANGTLTNPTINSESISAFVAQILGTPTAGHCVIWYSATQIEDSGSAGCGGTGITTTGSPSANLLTVFSGTNTVTSIPAALAGEALVSTGVGFAPAFSTSLTYVNMVNGTNIPLNGQLANYSGSPTAGHLAEWSATSSYLVDAGSTPNLGTPSTSGYTISGLPTCNSGAQGTFAFVTNGQTSPPYLGSVSTTGSTVAPVFCNGSGWVYH